MTAVKINGQPVRGVSRVLAVAYLAAFAPVVLALLVVLLAAAVLAVAVALAASPLAIVAWTTHKRQGGAR